MAKKSAGILAYRYVGKTIEFLLVHPGGPFFAKKDDGAWTIPKGEFEEPEQPLDAAIREFEEELGIKIQGDFTELLPVKQKSGKLVYAWAIEADINIDEFRSNTFTIEWPPKSGKTKDFPEIDKAQWFGAEEAMKKINAAQTLFIKQMEENIKT